MCCIVFNASHVFVYCSFRNAPVDALADVFRRDVVSSLGTVGVALFVLLSLFVGFTVDNWLVIADIENQVSS